MTAATEDLQALSSQTRSLLAKLNPCAAQAPVEYRPAWAEHLERLTELAQLLDADGTEPATVRSLVPVPAAQWVQFGRLLRDKRNAAGFSRVQLAHRAKISAATIKFIETARHPPSRAALIRLIGVSDLKLGWPDVPGHPQPPAPEAPAPGESPQLRGPLNCFLAPSHDPLTRDPAGRVLGRCGHRKPRALPAANISPPLLAAAYHHAVSHLASLPQVHVWAIQGNFHHLSLYEALHRPVAQPRRLITLLGETLAHLDHEPQFVQQSLVDCHRGDLLLLDLPVAPASCADPALIPRHDRLFAGGVPAPYACWIGHFLWRHCPQAERIDFHWELEPRRPIPGSYALHAIAAVTAS